jgi:hypothetical protein
MFMKLDTANSANPTLIRMRGSIRFISRGTSGIRTSCGNLVHASTAPICSEL